MAVGALFAYTKHGSWLLFVCEFSLAPEIRSDASKSGRFSGGGYISACGRYSFWAYGSRASRQLIDFLEGDTVVVAVEQMGSCWHRCCVPFGIDNSTFQSAARRGRSGVERLNGLVKELFALQVQHTCVLDPFWLSSEDNVLADHLSRDREDECLVAAFATGFWLPDVCPQRHADAGTVRRLPERRGLLKKNQFAAAVESPPEAHA